MRVITRSIHWRVAALFKLFGVCRLHIKTWLSGILLGGRSRHNDGGLQLISPQASLLCPPQ